MSCFNTSVKHRYSDYALTEVSGGGGGISLYPRVELKLVSSYHVRTLPSGYRNLFTSE